MNPPVTLRIIVSSPGDGAPERFLAETVIGRLQAIYRHACRLEPIFWEHEPLTATSSFQEGLPSPAETDIVVCILWSRLGTRLPRHVAADRPLTGTEYEFEEAVRGKRQRGLPDLLVYRKVARPLTDLSDRTQRKEVVAQIEALEAFIDKWFHDAEGALVAAFHPFGDAATFEEHLEHHLRKLIDQRLKAAGVSLADADLVLPTWTAGSPFRGLNPFDLEHAPVFHGRTRAIGEVVDRLKEQDGRERAFLLVLGRAGPANRSWRGQASSPCSPGPA
jgi:hypothetical protein